MKSIIDFLGEILIDPDNFSKVLNTRTGNAL